MKSIMGIIDATVRYPSLAKLTKDRTPCATPFAGRYRLIDFTLSSMKNSNIRNVALFPSGNYLSLNNHLSSGKIWDLNRKKDGLFIIPPKSNNEQENEIISFIRLKEHLNYFIRSIERYVVLTSGVIIWNSNFNDLLENHIKSGKDITEVVGLSTYILKKDLFIDLLLQHEYLGYVNIQDVIQFPNKLNINKYQYKGYAKMIKTINDYFDSNMDILNFNIGRTIFTNESPILSKIIDLPPSYYGENARVSNSIVAHGATINGNVQNSVISRAATIETGAKVSHCLVLPEARVERNAIIDYCIIDKNGIVGENVVLKGERENPLVIQKHQKVTNNTGMTVLHVASECTPFIKTGGLADVLGALPKKQRELGLKISVCLPLYKQIQEHLHNQLQFETLQILTLNHSEISAKVFSFNNEGITYYFVAIEDYFNRDKLYGHSDDLTRYYLFNQAVIHLIKGITPKIVHLHDYHTCLIPILMKRRSPSLKVNTCLTIHNLQYMGVYHDEAFIKANLADVTNEASINLLNLGILEADKITTVSPTYSKEIEYEYFSGVLQPSIIKRKKDISGILNGLDYDEYDPMRDSHIMQNYDEFHIEHKIDNKRHLQYTSNLVISREAPLIGMVTRLVEQKGLDLILSVFSDIMDLPDVQFVLLGTGETHYEEQFRELEERYKGRVKVNLGYNSFNPNLIYAGCDLFLMPSRFEPCGLAQMIALRYGTIPVVRETGGLCDTIKPYNEFTQCGNGFSFTNYNAGDMLHTIKRAINFYYDKNHWHNLMKCAMRSEFSYDHTAREYIKLYETMLK